MSTLNLVSQAWRLTLITDAQGTEWGRAAAAASASSGVPITVHTISSDGGLSYVEVRWNDINGLELGGALLVRPDQVIAWKSVGAGTDPKIELTDAVQTVLGAARSAQIA